jgi:WD40 repeat protein
VNRFLTQGMSISPDGKWLVYPVVSNISQQASPRSILVADALTGRETEIIHEAPFVETAWLFDSRLLVIEYPNWHISSDGTRLFKGTVYHTVWDPRTGRNTPATWYVSSPENGKILYSPDFDCAAELLYHHQEQDTLRILCEGAKNPVTIATPLSLGDVAWSPDGQFLAFLAGEEALDSWQLFVWCRETGLQEKIHLDTDYAFALSWSPNNQWLAFESGLDLCMLSLANESATCFASYLSGVGQPVSWSPDSKSVVLATCASGVCEQAECDCSNPALVTVSVPDGVITVLTTGVDISFTPLWGK